MGISFLSEFCHRLENYSEIARNMLTPPAPFPWMEWGLALELALPNQHDVTKDSERIGAVGHAPLCSRHCPASPRPRRRLRQAGGSAAAQPVFSPTASCGHMSPTDAFLSATEMGCCLLLGNGYLYARPAFPPVHRRARSSCSSRPCSV